MKKHYVELDSLRGLAALTVLVGHFLLIFTFVEPDTFSNHEYNIWNIFKYSPLHILFAGYEAVILFFLLSGFVLSLPFYKNDFSFSKQWYKGYLIKRFFRIYLPYIISTLIAIVMVLLIRPSFIEGASDFVNRLWASDLTLRNLLGHTLLIGEFNTSTLNPVIWSLSHEMRISIIFPFLMYAVLKFDYKKTFAIALFFSIASYGLLSFLPYKGAISIWMSPHYAAIFIIGALLAKHIDSIVSYIRGLKPLYKLVLFCLALCTYTYKWNFYDVDILHIGIVNEWSTVFGASLFIIVAFSSSTMSAFLNLKPIHYLGKISYSLYLYHTISLLFVVHLINNYDAKASILAASFVLSFILAVLSYHFVEIPSIKLGRRLSSTKKKDIPESPNKNSKAL